jgi:hypothetical protein
MASGQTQRETTRAAAPTLKLASALQVLAWPTGSPVTAIQASGDGGFDDRAQRDWASRRDAIATPRLSGGDLTKQPELLHPPATAPSGWPGQCCAATTSAELLGTGFGP